MSTTRARRAEQVEQNRERVLAAAREVFVEQGFHAASLDLIAERAGFTKGVVYSQFASKADLFLTLLERRIAERAADNARIAARAASPADLGQLVDLWVRTQRAEPAWTLLVMEFRIHAARHPELNQRYARAHEQTVQALARVLADVYARLGAAPPDDPRELAGAVLALGNGQALEEATGGRRWSVAATRRHASRLLGLATDQGGTRP